MRPSASRPTGAARRGPRGPATVVAIESAAAAARATPTASSRSRRPRGSRRRRHWTESESPARMLSARSSASGSAPGTSGRPRAARPSSARATRAAVARSPRTAGIRGTAASAKIAAGVWDTERTTRPATPPSDASRGASAAGALGPASRSATSVGTSWGPRAGCRRGLRRPPARARRPRSAGSDGLARSAVQRSPSARRAVSRIAPAPAACRGAREREQRDGSGEGGEGGGPTPRQERLGREQQQRQSRRGHQRRRVLEPFDEVRPQREAERREQRAFRLGPEPPRVEVDERAGGGERQQHERLEGDERGQGRERDHQRMQRAGPIRGEERRPGEGRRVPGRQLAPGVRAPDLDAQRQVQRRAVARGEHPSRRERGRVGEDGRRREQEQDESVSPAEPHGECDASTPGERTASPGRRC